MARRRCTSKTKAGRRCRAAPLKADDRCIAHTRKDEIRQGFGGPQPGSGRPRLPRPHERMRELVEENVEEIVAPYLEAVRSAVVIAKHEGEVHTSEVADHGARINAAERLLNRVYGRPRQEVELGASETGAPLAIVATDDRAAADAAREFLAKLIPDA